MPDTTELVVRARVSMSDVRARILRFPREIRAILPDDRHTLTGRLHGELETHPLTIDASRTYLAAVTSIYRNAGLLRNSGSAAEVRSADMVLTTDTSLREVDIQLIPTSDWTLVGAPTPADTLEDDAPIELVELEANLAQQGRSHREFFIPLVRAISALGGSGRRRSSLSPPTLHTTRRSHVSSFLLRRAPRWPACY